MFVVRTLEEIRRKVKVSLFVCLINPRSYETVDRTFRWQVLTRIGIPPQMIAPIRQLYHVIKASVQPNNGVCLDSFEGGQGLRQG